MKNLKNILKMKILIKNVKLPEGYGYGRTQHLGARFRIYKIHRNVMNIL